MNIQPDQRISKAAFIGWGATEEERYELVRRSRRHDAPSAAGPGAYCGQSVRRFAKPARPKAMGRHPGVRIGCWLRYPALSRHCSGSRGRSGESLRATAPVLVAEVLSPASVEIDLGDKRAEYLRIPSLLAYVVLSQDEPKAWIWTRKEGGFQLEPEILDGAESSIRVAALKVELPLSEVYADVEFD